MRRHARPTRCAVALGLALLAGCGRGDAPPEAMAVEEGAALAPLPATFEGAWQGVLPCSDCAGLDIELLLQREADAPGRYRLVETYLGGGDSAAGFEVSGEWRESACRRGDDAGFCIELIESAQRWFRDLDGSLQAIDAEGRPIDPDAARLLRR